MHYGGPGREEALQRGYRRSKQQQCCFLIPMPMRAMHYGGPGTANCQSFPSYQTFAVCPWPFQACTHTLLHCISHTISSPTLPTSRFKAILASFNPLDRAFSGHLSCGLVTAEDSSGLPIWMSIGDILCTRVTVSWLWNFKGSRRGASRQVCCEDTCCFCRVNA